MKINEIFLSISGESFEAGKPAVFIRTHGCSLRCSYCDSLYAVEGEDYTEMLAEEILNKVKSYECKKIVLTGGEPLDQPDAVDLIKLLIDNGYSVEVETNGAVDLLEVSQKIQLYSIIIVGIQLLPKPLTFTMDWKCPSSKMNRKMLRKNLSVLRKCDVIKFVVGSKEDLDEMKEVSKETLAQVFVSPVFGKIEPKDIVQYILENKLWNVRFQLQIHKFVWSPETKGV